MKRRGKPRARRWTVLQGALVALVAASSVGLNARFEAPPRYDGAGYAVLAESLRTGRGYRAIDHPDAPRHAHFPPGYPLTLAGLWRLGGPSTRSAHVLSMACTVAAVVAAWGWFRRLYRPGIALALGLALAANWTWGRLGGGIQSEPLFLLLEMAAVLATGWAARGGAGRGVILGVILGAATLTRHVGVMLAVAAGLDLLARGSRRAALGAAASAAAVVAPWVAWVASVREGTQVGLLGGSGLPGLVASQVVFYGQRLPDQLVGPVVEIGTVFLPALWWPMTGFAAAASAAIVWGWIRFLRSRRRRLAGLVPAATLPLLLVWPFTEAGRFLVPLVPFAIAGAAEGLAWLLARVVARRWAGRARGWAAGLVLLASIPYPAYAILAGRAEAAEATHADFDAACAWIGLESDPPGPVLTRQPGEVFWQTGRNALPPPGDDLAAIDRLIDRHDVAFLIVDEDRYAHAPASPLGRYVRSRLGRVEPVWSQGSAAIYAVVRDHPRVDDRPRPDPSGRAEGGFSEDGLEEGID